VIEGDALLLEGADELGELARGESRFHFSPRCAVPYGERCQWLRNIRFATAEKSHKATLCCGKHLKSMSK
jgi:hypothetical protein